MPCPGEPTLLRSVLQCFGDPPPLGLFHSVVRIRVPALLDRFGAPQAGSMAAEAGCLIDPSKTAG